MHGPRRVAAFCLLTAVLPTLLIIIPLYLRHSVFADVYYQVAESDVIEIREGISTIFCQAHSLSMNTSFHSYQLSSLPEMSKNRKHIRLKKSMVLPDDTLEYWGFYLLKGSTVALKACSRYDGSRILVVRGERTLRTCGLLEHNVNKPHLDREHTQVRVTFETAAQEINDTGVHEDRIHLLQPLERKIEEEDDEENTGAEMDDPVVIDDDEINKLDQYASNYLKKRHGRKHQHSDQIQQLQQDLNAPIKRRRKRETGHKIDGAIGHGGNAINYSKPNQSDESNSVSSFETNLFNCYSGQILLTQSFDPHEQCKDVHYLSKGDHMQMIHEVSTDGYYYYIFYSDNDRVSNDIHAVFDIYKPTLQYTNISKSKQCINNTECNFGISFMSDETVIVEVPTRDGIEHEEDDITLLVSKCKPRMAVYIVFPIAVLFLILGCAFL